MIRIGICDDDLGIRMVLQSFCDQYFGGRRYETRHYGSGEEFLERGEENLEETGEKRLPDILLLDVEMGAVDGIQIKHILQRQKREVRILFVTNHEELFRGAYGKYVFGFLTKPLSYEAFEEKMQEVEEDLDQSERCVVRSWKGPEERIRLSGIRYIKADGKYVKLHMENGGEALYDERGIGTWEKLAGADFAMSHKSYLINLAKVKGIRGEYAVFADGENVKISRRMKTRFRERYRAYLLRSAR